MALVYMLGDRTWAPTTHQKIMSSVLVYKLPTDTRAGLDQLYGDLSCLVANCLVVNSLSKDDVTYFIISLVLKLLEEYIQRAPNKLSYLNCALYLEHEVAQDNIAQLFL